VRRRKTLYDRAVKLPRCFLPLMLGVLIAVVPAQAASPPGVLVIAQSLDDLVSLDPAEGFELSSVQTFTNVYQRLVQPDPDHPASLLPALASRWQADPGARSLTFELAADARFAGGNPVRPEDVIFSLSRAVKLNRAPVFILNELGWNAGNVDGALRKIDARHVRLSWDAPVGPALALNILTAPVASILDTRETLAHAVGEDLGNAWLRAHSAGSGPFKIRRYIPHEALVLDANPNAPGGAPRLQTIVIKNVTDAATRRLLVAVGDADIARDLGPDQIAALGQDSQVETLVFPSAMIDYLMFNTANPDNAALRNPALWEAARWLIDYDGIAAKLLRGEYFVHQAFLAQGFPGGLAATPYHLDIAKARSILAAAGIEPGLRITLDVINQPPYGDIALSLQASFAQAGITLEIVPELAGELYTKIRARNEQAVWLYWVPDYFDANSTASAFAANREDGTKTLAWRAGWRIPALSAATAAAATETDPATRIEDYLAIQREVQQRSPFVIAFQARNEVVLRKGIHGYREGLDADMVYYDRISK